MAEIVFHSMAESAYLWTAMHVADEKGVAYKLVPLVTARGSICRCILSVRCLSCSTERSTLRDPGHCALYDRTFEGLPLQPVDALGQARCCAGSASSMPMSPDHEPVHEGAAGEAGLRRGARRRLHPERARAACTPMRLIDAALTRSRHLAGEALISPTAPAAAASLLRADGGRCRPSFARPGHEGLDSAALPARELSQEPDAGSVYGQWRDWKTPCGRPGHRG